jgi:hypothetical protein
MKTAYRSIVRFTVTLLIWVMLVSLLIVAIAKR